jgi:hypothetical protein
MFEFPIYNPTNEPVYLSIDLDHPSLIAGDNTSATWSTESFDGRWVYRDTASNINCGSVVIDPGPPPIYRPDHTLPGCSSTNPTPNNNTLFTASGNIPRTDFTVRTWATTTYVDLPTPSNGALTELTPCPGCSTTPAGPNRIRVTVLVPPRGTDVTKPPVKVFIMPSLRPSAAYRPHGGGAVTATDFTAASRTLTGNNLGTTTRCSGFTAPSTPSGDWRCTTTITLGAGGIRTAFVLTGLVGTTTTTPHHLGGISSRVRDTGVNVMNTTESPTVPGL